MAFRQLQSLVKGLRKDRLKNQLKARRSQVRRALAERLEDRRMFAGPELIAIRPDAGALLRDGDTLNSPPRAFNLLFEGGANLSEASISASSIRLFRSGGDGDFTNGNEVEVSLGYVGLVNPGDSSPSNLQQIVMRPASLAAFNASSATNQFPDDSYQIQILGSGPNFISNTSGEAFNGGVNETLTFRLDRGAQVVAVVPQPVSRNTQQLSIGATGGNYRLTFNGRTTGPIPHNANAATIQAALLTLRNVQPGDVTVSPTRAITFQGQYAGEQIPLMTIDNSGLTGGIGTVTRSGALSQASNQIVVYFDDQRLNAAEVIDPKFYRLTDTAGTSLINDDRVLLPQSVTYDHINNSAVLFFANDIPEGNYRLDVGVSGGVDNTLASALVVGSLYDGRSFTSNQFLGDAGGVSTDNTDVDLFRVDLQFGATLSVVLTPGTPALSLRGRLLDKDGAPVPMASIVTPPGAAVTWNVPITATQAYYIEIVSVNGQTGAYRIDASVTGTPLNINDSNSWIGNATPVGVVGATTIAVTSQIQAQAIPLPPLPGGEDEPGHRGIQRETHINSIGTTPTVPMPTKVIEYHFPASLGTDSSGNSFTNFLTATERQIVRDIFEIFARKSGFEFIEAQGVGSLAIGKGNLQAINPNISNTAGPSNSGITGLQNATAIVLNNTQFNQANRFYGDSFTLAMYHQIGHALGLGHSFDQPSVMGSYDEFPAQGNPLQNNVLPGDVDLVHLQRIAPPNSTDIDVFSFSLVQSGRFTAETVAERLATPSMLNSVLTLYRRLPSGEVELVARNDQYYGADAFLDLTLNAGDYFIAVSSVGNTQFDPRVPDSGFGGSTNGAYELKMNFVADRNDSLRDTNGTAFDGDADGKPGGVYSFWFQASDPAQTIYVDKTDTNGVGTIASPFNTISSALAAAGSRIVIPTTATAAGLIGQRFVVDDGVNAPVTFTYSATAGARLIQLVAGDTPAQIASRTNAAIIAARTAGSLAPTVTPTLSGRIVRFSGIDNLDLGLAPTLLSAPNLVRIVGNGGADQNVDTITDNRPYLIGLSVAETPLADGAEFLVPQGVTVMVHAGALFKMRKANLDVGTSAPDVNRAQGALQLLGTPEHSVFLRSYHDDTVGGNSDGVGPVPESGDFGGVVFRGDSDMERAGIFLNYVNHTDIHQGGGKVFVGAEELSFSSIHLDDARPTISFNRISSSVTSAISASPNSFEDTIDRLGPDVDGNFLVNNSIDGLFVRIDTPLGSNIDKLTVSGRFDDTDIAHILSENLIIAGAGGGLVRLADGTLQARPAGRLVIDAGVVLKLNRARIEAERGAGSLIAEGTIDAPVIFTSLADDRFGGSGSFNSDRTAASTPARGNWGGLFFGEATSGSIAHSIISFGGGIAPIEGGAAAFNAVEIHQADVRISNSELRDNASGAATGVRNGRGLNGAAVIYVRGAQPIIVDNIIEDNSGAAININANSLNFVGQRDYGQARGPVNDYEQFADNHGPLVRLNRLENNTINGMLVRGELLTTESIWDDTDIVHVLQNLITVDNLHTYGGLTLQSSNSESLVVKLSGGAGTGFTATGSPTDIIDRIGGTIHVLGTVGHPVIFTSLTDDTIGAGFTPSGAVNRNTNNSATPTTGTPGAWRGFLFDEFSNDRNVAAMRELENPLTNRRDVNSTPQTAQLLGTLAPNEKSGDENRRLGFQIKGFVSPNDPNDVDVYGFTGDAGTRVWIDIDRTDTALDAIIEVIGVNGTVLARSIQSSNPGLPGSLNALPLTQNEHLGGDHYTTNFRDPGFFYVLPTTGLHYVRVRSNPASAANVATIAGESRGAYQLQIRLQQVNEFPGSTVQFADIRFAQTGIDVRGLPKHSPLVAEAGELEGDNGSFDSAQTLVNLLQTDIAALGLSGALSTATDVDWYRFDLAQTEVQTISGVNTNPGTIAVVLDMDFADQLSADTTIAIYDEFQRLIYVGRESNVQDDQPIDASGNINDLSRGSLGKKDPYIGPIHLIPGQSYFVAVMSDRQLPSALTGAFLAAPANPASQLVRLEPVTTLYRVVEDHIGSQGFLTQGNPIIPLTPGGLFDISSPAALNNHVRPFTFGDVQLYVATDFAGTESFDSLYTVNPFTGTIVTQVSSGNNFVGGENDIQDIVIRSDGRMFGYQRVNAGTTTGRVGALVELDPSTGAIISTQPDNIDDQTPTPNTASLNLNLGSHLSRAEQFTTSNEVDALTFRRRGSTGSFTAPVPIYETYYAVREADNSSKLYRGRQNGDASPAIASGGEPRYGVMGHIQPAGVTFASRTLTVSDSASPASVTSIRIESKLPGSAGNSILLNFTRPNNTAATVDVAGTTITLNIGATGGPPPTGAPTAAAIVDAINNDPDASRLVTAVIVGGNGANGNGSNGTVALNLFGGFFGGLNGPLTGGSIDSVVAPLRGRVTGLSYANLNGNGDLFGVTNAGEFLRINASNGVVLNRIDMANSLGIANLNFQGLALGPQNVQDGAFANTLFAVTGDGRLVAFDTNGNGVLAFDSAVSTSSQRIVVESGAPNAGFFTLTFDTGTSRETTVPISVDAPSTVSVNETQSLDTIAYGGTFTLSFVDDVRAVTSPVAAIPASFSGSSESLLVENGAVFPVTPFVISVQNEQMLVTARTGNTLTVTRGINGTTAAAHPDTATISEVVTSSLTAALPAPAASTLTANVDLTNPGIVTVASAAAFPAAPYTIRLNNEEMVVTAVAGNQLTVLRGQNGTAIAQHAAGAQVRVVSQSLTVADGTPFAAAGFNIRINNEDIRVVSRTGNVMDVIRGVNATTPAAHAIGSQVFKLDTTAPLPFNATAAQVRTALGNLPGIGGIGNVQVSFGPLSGANTNPVTVEFTGALAARNLRPLTANTTGLVGTEIQQVSINSSASAGTFQLQFQGQQTAPIAFNATAAAVQAALQALPNIGAGNVLVTGAALPAGTLDIEFVGSLRNTNVPQVTVVNNLLRFNERQQLTMVGGPAGGTFTLSMNDGPNGLVGTTVALPFNATADLIETELQNAIPGLVGNIVATGGPFPGAPVVIEFIGALAATNVAQITATGALTGGTAPAVNTSTLPNPTPPFVVGTLREGQTVSAPIVQGTDGVLSVRDALVGLPSIGPGDVQVAGNLQGAGVLVNFQGAFANVVPNALIVDDFLLQNTTEVNVTVNLPDPTLPDSFISSQIPSLVANPVGLAFSPLDFNLWHTTNRRGGDAGHGINPSPDGARSGAGGGTSMHFGFEPWDFDRATYIAPIGLPNRQFGIRTTLQHQDLSSNPAIRGSYNFPGGAHGTLTTNTFDLANSVADDRPTLYFNYFLETQNHPGSATGPGSVDPFRDSARVFASTDGGLTWALLATNNSVGERPAFLSHLSDAGLSNVNPRPEALQIVQEMADNTGTWRQARVDLSTYAGQQVMLRFDFATAGAMNDPTLGDLDADFGEFSNLNRSIRSLNNQFEGFYIDDIIVGFAERGELVTGAVSDPGITDLFTPGLPTRRDNSPGRFPESLTGPYQMEIRRAGEFQQLGVAGSISNLLAARFQTNDRHVLEGTLTANVTFEPGTPVPSLVPVSTVLGGVAFPAGAISPWSVSAASPFTGAQSLQSGTFSPGQTGSIFQASAATLAVPGAATHQAGIIRFAYRVDSEGGTDGLQFFINGIPQRFPQGSTENVPGTFLRASGTTDYRIVEFPFGSGDPTLGGTDVVFSWLYAPGLATVPGTAFIDQIQLVQGGTGLLADRNRERAQGVFNITSNFITNSSVRAINVEPGTAQASGGVPHPGSIINFPQQNVDRLVPGVVIQNNVLAGGSGIRFAGETAASPQRPVPFGRIFNNTIVGNDRGGVGIEVVGLASPTLLNNILTDLGTGIVDGGVGTVIRTNFFQNNAANGVIGTASLSGGTTGSPFVNAAQRNYYLVPGSLAVDSSQETEQDRFNHVTFKNEIGIPESPIKAPDRDVFGQLRVDSTGSPVGGGATVFIDRGAVDRSDFERPYAQLLNPIDNDSAGQDRDPNSSVVYLTNPLLENFQILLGDGRGPSSPFEGTGVNGLTVFDPSNPAVSSNSVRVFHDGQLLVQGVDYTLGYNSLTGVLLLTPLSTLWKQSGVYTIALDNTRITDLAGNRLRSNQADGSTQFFILMPDVRLDFGDAPASYGTLLANNPARHSIQPGATPRLGVRIDSEVDAPATVDGDDITQVVVVNSTAPLFVIPNASGPQVTVIAGGINGGEELNVQIGSRSETFELVLPGFAPQRGNIAIGLSTESIAQKLVAAINATLVSPTDRTTVSIDSIDGTTLRIQTFASPEGLIPAEPVTITSLSGLFVPSAGGQLTVNPAFTVMGGERFTVQIGTDSATFELVLPGATASGTNVAIGLSSDETLVGKLVAAISSALVLEGNSASVTADATNTAAFNIETFDDEDGAGIGTFTNNGTVYRVFLRPGVPAATTDPSEVLGFLNPLDPLGANISITVTGSGLLDAWIDFNGNGIFNSDEQIFASTPVVEGVNTLRIVTPQNVTDKLTWARFRITEQGGVGPTGLAIGGEVEDYQVQVINIPLPTPVNDSFAIDEDTVFDAVNNLSLPSLGANDDVPPQTFLPVQYFIGQRPQNGDLVEFNTTNGRFIYRPRPDFYGTDVFTYRLANQSNNVSEGIIPGVTYATVTMTVRPVNDAPSARQQTFVGLEDTPFTITAAQLIAGGLADANAQFPVGAPAAPFNEANQVLNVVSLQTPTTIITAANANLGPFATPRGSITPTFDPVSGFLISLLYTPNQDVNADHGRVNGNPRLRDSFIFTVEDDGVLQTVDGVNIPGPVTRLRASNTAFIDVAPRNDAPVVAIDAVSVGIVGNTVTNTPWRAYFVGLNQPVPVPTEDTTLTIPSGYLLLNDIAGNLTSIDENTFVNGNDGPLRIVSVSTLTSGMTVSLDTSGNVVLTPPADIYGDVVFTYTVEDRGINEDVAGVRTATPLRSTTTVTVTLQPVNDPPVASDRNLTFVESAAAGTGPAFTFNAARLITGIAGETPSVPGDFATGLIPPFNEVEQTLRIVAFRTSAGTVDVNSLPGGNGSLTLASAAGGTFTFNFAGGAFTTGNFVSAPDYNERTPFAPNEALEFLIADNGRTTRPQGSGFVFLPGERALATATATITITQTNDAPVFVSPGRVDVLERDDSAATTVPFATSILPGPTTARDEIQRQTVSFEVIAAQSTIPAGLFLQNPVIAADGSLSVFPAPDAVGSATIVFDAVDAETGTANFVERRTRGTVTINVRPVNDLPSLNPAVVGTTVTRGPDDAWTVDASTGTIRFTLKEDNTGAGGVPAPYVLDARSTASAANRLGLLDPFLVGPANEANSTLGGSQSLRVSAFAATTALGGTVTVLATDPVSGAPIRFAYTPPTDYNRLQGVVDSFVYTITDNAPLGETWDLAQSGLIEDNRSVQGRVEFVLNPVNDRPIFTVASPTLSVLEDAGPVLIVNFATNISVASPTTALDELPAQTLTFSLTPVTPVGSLFAVPPSISPNGTLTFTPATDAVGSVTYDVFATDTGANDPARGDLNQSLPTRITLNIRPVNDAPRLDATVLGTSQTQNSDEAWGVDSSGVITYTLKEDNTGALGVTSPYIINVRRDPAIVGYQRVGLIDIFTVGPTNEADSTLGGSQVLRLFSFGNQGRTALGGTIRAIGFDSNNDVTQLEYIPPVDFNESIGGLDSFTFTVQDNNPGAGETFNLATGQLTENRLTASSTVQFRLRPVNDPPQFNVAEPVVSVLEDTGAVSFEDFVTDIFAGPPNTAFDEIDLTTGQSVTFSVAEVTTVAGLFATPPTISPNGTLSFVTAPDAFGQAVYEVRATDNGMDNATRGDIVSSGFRLITINVRPVNDRPVLNTTTPIVVTLNEDATILNSDGTITNRGTLIPLRGTIASPGLLDVFAPGPANEAANLTPGGNQTIRISTPIPTGTVNGGTLSRELDSFGNLTGLRYTPRPNFNGIDSFVYGVIDDGVSADIDGVVTSDPREGFTTVTLEVRALNDAPIFGGAPSVTVQEDATTTSVVGQTIIANWATNIQAGPAGALDELNPVTGQTVTFTVNPVPGNPTGLFTVTPTVSPDGTLRFTTALNANGVAVFTVVASDNGTGNPPLEFNTSSPPRTFTITVGGVNDPPTFTAGGNVVVNEDSGQYSSPTPYATNISPGPADEVAAGQTVRFEVVTPQSGRSLFAEGGLPEITDAGFLRFTPADNANGAVVVSVTAIDSEGGRSATVSLTITIEEVNDTPVANNDSFTTNEDTVLTITQAQLLANDVDPDLVTNPNEVLSIFGVPAVSLSGAVLRLGTNGTLEYDPRGATALQALAPGQTRSDTFIYRLRDAAGAVSNTATVTVNVTGINDAPTLLPDTPTLAPTGDTVIRPLLNDFDIDGTINPASLRIDLQPAFGSVRVEADGTLIYTPFEGFRGQDVIRYSVADNLGLRSEQQTITIDINQAPVAVNDASGTFRDESVDINVAANDTDSDGTLNLNSIQIVTQPLRGSVIVAGGGIVRYLPEPGFTGLESFQYTIRDNGGRASNVATVTVQTVGSRLQNPRLFTDVNASGQTSPIDALLIINLLSRASRQGQTGGIPVLPTDQGPNFYDVDGSMLITASDALRVINQISRENRARLTGGEGEASTQQAFAAPSINTPAANPLSSTVSRESLADSAVTSFASQDQVANFGVMDDRLVASIARPQEEEKEKQDGDRLAAIDAAWADAAPL